MSKVFMILLLLMSFFSPGHCYASTVLEFSIDDLLQHAEFIFEGTVTSIQSKQSDPKRIHTYVTFAISDVIKGEYPKNEITIRFLGGAIDNAKQVVSGLQLPEVGEHGVYFIESLKHHQANPIVGWDQGHFIIKKDELGHERVLTNKRLPVLSVKQKQAAAMDKVEISKGVARDLEIGQPNQYAKALPLMNFKDLLHKKLRANK